MTLILLLLTWPIAVRAAAVGYSMTVTTAYATANPFPNRLDQFYTGADTGYFQITNTGDSFFTGVVGTIAVSAFAGDLSFASGSILLAPGGSVSVAIPDDASDAGGFNGPAYFFRPGVEITLNGTFSDGILSQAVALLVADADIHSGTPRTDSFGLTSDSFVLQGGDPWGFDPGDAFELSQANGVYVFIQTVPEPRSAAIMMAAMVVAAIKSRRFRRCPRHSTCDCRAIQA